MKKHLNIFRITLSLLLLFACDDPETTVTNFVNTDGSVTKRVVMKSFNSVIDPKTYKVPVDSTWSVAKTVEIDNNDTVWIFTMEKDFSSVEDINKSYREDSGSNKLLIRSATFKRKFRWFNTVYSYSEKVNRILNVQINVEDYFGGDELKIFNMNESEIDSLLKGPDSLMYRAQKIKADSIAEQYLTTALVEEWVMHYLKLVPDSAFIHSKKDSLISNFASKNLEKDSVFIPILGKDYYLSNIIAIDSAYKLLDNEFEKIISSKSYTCETVMPGKIISTNGFIDNSGKTSWNVEAKYFVSQDYLMFAESRVVNKTAWIISIILLISLIGIIIKK